MILCLSARPGKEGALGLLFLRTRLALQNSGREGGYLGKEIHHSYVFCGDTYVTRISSLK